MQVGAPRAKTFALPFWGVWVLSSEDVVESFYSFADVLSSFPIYTLKKVGSNPRPR